MRFHSDFRIRTYHTDGFGHVNNARYLELLEEARWQYAESIELTELLNEANVGFIIMELQIRFRIPVVAGDLIRVSTRLITLGSASGEVVQEVTKENSSSISTRCLAHFILIDRDNNRSIPIDGKIRQCLLGVIESENANVITNR